MLNKILITKEQTPKKLRKVLLRWATILGFQSQPPEIGAENKQLI
jgi:hypothetical protein